MFSVPLVVLMNVVKVVDVVDDDKGLDWYDTDSVPIVPDTCSWNNKIVA